MNVILELGCNHNGSLATAKRMIDDAVKLGVKGVKLQKRDVESMSEDVKRIPRNSSNSFGSTYYEHRKFLEFNIDKIMDLKHFAEARGLIFAVSVFDLVSMQDIMDVCKVQYVKLPSQFFLNPEMNREMISIANKDLDISIWHSTGMHTAYQIESCPFIDEFNVTFYCRSMYPFPETQADIGSALRLFNFLAYNERKGYSSHDKDGKIIPTFVLMGAQWIERHYTLNKNMKGSDHGTVSSDFKEMKNILRSIDRIQECLYANTLSDEEKRVRDIYIKQS